MTLRKGELKAKEMLAEMATERPEEALVGAVLFLAEVVSDRLDTLNEQLHSLARRPPS